MPLELLQAGSAIVFGCLVGTLAYLVPIALRLQPEPCLPPARAVVWVPEQFCRSLRCLLSPAKGHLVEVDVVEKSERLMKVGWPRGFEHLDEWLQIGGVSDVAPATARVHVVEQLPAQPLWTPTEFEQWLDAAGAQLDTLDSIGDSVSPRDAGSRM